MELPIFYAPPDCCSDDQVALPAAETHHALDVLRLRDGALVLVVDGLGTAYRGDLHISSKRQIMVRVHSKIRELGEPRVRLTLAAGLSAGYKFDEVVDRGTQLGVIRFVPVVTERSKVKADDPRKVANKTVRLEKVALAAMKQCRRSYRPEVSSPMSFSQFLQQVDRDALKLIFHPDAGAKPLADLTIEEPPRRVIVLVGPEAGFSSDEVKAAEARGFQAVTLGGRILRTENAGPVIAALVMERFGELR